MGILLFDPKERNNFLPLTFTRAFAEIYAGTMTLQQWWEKVAVEKTYILTQKYLGPKYEACPENESYIYINAAAIPSADLWKALQTVDFNEFIFNKKNILLGFKSKEMYRSVQDISLPLENKITVDATVIEYPFQLCEWNKRFFELQQIFLPKKNKVVSLYNTNLLIHKEAIFVEEGCTVQGCIINASEGPVYISKNCLLMEGSLIRGPFFLGENSVVKMGTRIYGATTIGKKCTVGGEIKNIIMHNHSNKAHDGYLGDALIGSWCNFGAGTSCSNVKNTAGNIKLTNFATQEPMHAGLKFGTLTGDFVRTAINTSINSGTSIGVCCNIFGQMPAPNTIPNFTWGTHPGSYKLEEALKHIQNWMNFKQEILSPCDEAVLKWLYQCRA